MSGRALQTSRYSPGNLAPEVLERMFVGRSELLAELIGKVSRSILSRDKQHVLLVGPRGTGKTHFLALLHQRLATDPGLAAERAQSVIAYLNEEEWGVASFLDFLLVILRSLRSAHAEIAGRIALVEQAFERDPETARDLAEDTLVQVVKDRTLVLLCENLHALFEGLGAEGQARWRSLVQEHRSWCIVATVPSLFFAISRQTEPFYGFFTIRSLEKLSLEDAFELLHRKAELEGRHDLAAALDTATGRARVRAIHHLAGGNHRAYIVLSEFLTRESLDELVSPFMNMVDDLTPYYQERMRNLTSPLQRKLVDYLCRQRTPSTVKDIARATLVQPTSAAKQLGELAKSGIVQKTPRGRESLYELSEPLMRICIEVKDNRTEYIRIFVDLLRHWFSSRDPESRLHDAGVKLRSTNHDELRERIASRVSERMEEDGDLLYESCLVSMNQGKLDDVVAAAERLSALGAAARSRSLMLLSRAARQGMGSILGELTPEGGDLDDGTLLEILDTGLWIELQQRGPSSFAAQVIALSDQVARRDRAEILTETLATTLRRLVRTRPVIGRGPEWTDALAAMTSHLPGFEVPLRLFSAGVRYAATRDEGVLLELPLEQRKLLTDEVGRAS